MPIVVECGACKKRFKAGDQLAGKRVKCPGCQAVLTIPALGPAASSPSAPPNPFAPPPSQQHAAKPAVSPAASPNPIAGMLDDDIPVRQESGPPAALAGVSQAPQGCPACGAPVASGAVLCVNCGYDFRSKTKHGFQKGGEAPAGKPKKKRRARSGEMSQWMQLARGCVVSFIGAMMGAFIWYLVAMFTESEWGLIAWGLGGLAGVGMAVGYGHEEALGGICAAVIALVAIVIAKVAIFVSILFPLISAMAEQAADDMVPGAAVEEVVAPGDPAPEAPGEKAAAEATGDETGGEASADEEPMADESSEEDAEVGDPGLVASGAALGVAFFFTMFGLFDIVAIILACATAFKVASSVGFGD